MNNLAVKIYKSFGIEKDSPIKTLSDYPEHDLFTSACGDGECYDNALYTAHNRQQYNPTIVHGTFPNGNHAWVEYDHPKYGKLVHDPTAGFAGSPTDMYEDPMGESKWFQGGGLGPSGEVIEEGHPLLQQPYLKPEVRYSWEEYKKIRADENHAGPFHEKAWKRHVRRIDHGIDYDHTDPNS